MKNKVLISRVVIVFILLTIYLSLRIFSKDTRIVRNSSENFILNNDEITTINIKTIEGPWSISRENNSWIIDIGATKLPADNFLLNKFITDITTSDRKLVSSDGNFDLYLGEDRVSISFYSESDIELYNFNIGYKNEDYLYIEYKNSIYQIESNFSRYNFDNNGFIDNRLFSNVNSYDDIISLSFNTDFSGELASHYIFNIIIESENWVINSESFEFKQNVNNEELANYFLKLINLSAESFMPTTEVLGQVRARISFTLSSGQNYRLLVGDTIATQPPLYKAKVEGSDWVYLLSEEDLKDIFKPSESFVIEN